ncbi:MAG: hypothetical protein QM817_23020 [Archangium sp.]
MKRTCTRPSAGSMSAVVTTELCVMRLALYCEPVSFTTAALLPKRGKRTVSAAASPGGIKE